MEIEIREQQEGSQTDEALGSNWTNRFETGGLFCQNMSKSSFGVVHALIQGLSEDISARLQQQPGLRGGGHVLQETYGTCTGQTTGWWFQIV